jgi:predicted permease
MDVLWQDVRHAIRILAKSPAFTAVAVVVLAFGIGLNAALFSIVNAFLFRPLPVRAPGELRYVYSQYLEQPQPPTGITYHEYLYLRDNTNVFREVFARQTDGATLRTGGDAEPVTGEMVTANYFDVLGVRAALGRTLQPADEVPNAEPVVVISHGLWRARFNADPNVLGRTIQLDARAGVGSGHVANELRPYTIVGVMAPEFRGTISRWEPAGFWVPVVQRAVDYEIDVRDFLRRYSMVVMVGRLKPGVTDEQAQAVIAAQGLQWHRAEYAASRERWTLILRDSPSGWLPFDRSGRVVPARLAGALMAVAGMVLLIAAANLAGILRARGVLRRAETAVRLALGAGRWRVTRQLLTEGVLLSALGGACGLLLARVLVALFLAYTPVQFGGRFSRLARFSLDIPVDTRVLAFTVVASAVIGLLIGLAPARQASRTDLLGALSGSAAAAPKMVRSRLRYWIVVPQVCLSLALLLTAGVFVRTLLNAELTDHGYDPEHVVYVDYQLQLITRELRGSDTARAREAARAIRDRRAAFQRALLGKVEALPDVTAATLAMDLPWQTFFQASVLARKDYAHAAGANRWVGRVDASPGYFSTFGIAILKGRAFDARDATSGRPVAIVCESLARLLWPGKDPIGEYLAHYDPKSGGEPKWREVVGVAKAVTPLVSDGAPRAVVYFPFGEEGAYAGSVVVRGRGRPTQLINPLTRAVRDTDASAAVMAGKTATEAIAEILYPRRMAAAMLAVSGLAGLFLAVVGIYGVVSYSVAQRTREIGIRAALGAQRHDILRLVIGEGMKVVVVGSIAGLALAVAATRAASSLVVSLPAIDALTFIIVPLFLAVVIVVACYVPARRAARVDPMIALREL